MKQKWLNVLLRLSGVISKYKNKLATASGAGIIAIGLWVLILECANFVVSLPTYFFISPKDFSNKNDEIAAYRLRRKVSLSVIGTIVLAVLLKVGVAALITAGLFSHGSRAHADTISWDFNNPVAYLYDASKIQVTDGMAILKANPLALTQPTIEAADTAISLPPTTGTVEATANTVPSATSTDTSVQTSIGSTSVTTETNSSGPLQDANAGIDVNTGSAPVETSPLAPVIQTAEATVNTSTPAPTSTSVPAPVETAPTAPSSGGLLNYIKSMYNFLSLRGVHPTKQSAFSINRLPRQSQNLPPRNDRQSTVSGTTKYVRVAHAAEQTCTATVQPLVPLAPLNLQNWTGFSDAVTGGTTDYQLSSDGGITWQYWNGSAWETADSTNYNDASTINEHIPSFPTTTSSILVKARMIGDCQTDVQLLNIDVTYDHTPPTAPELNASTYRLTAPLGITFTDAFGTSITATTKSAYITIGTQRIAYVELKGNLDLSTSLILNNPTAVLATLNPVAQNSIDTFELMVPKTLGQTEVHLCPGISALDAVLPSCPSGATLSATTPNVGAYALVKLDAPDYWYVDVHTTGVIAVGAAQVPPIVVAVPTAPVTSTTCGTIFNEGSLSGAITALNGVNDYSLTTEMWLDASTDAGIVMRNKDENDFWQLLFHGGTVLFSGKVNGVSSIAQNSNVVAFGPQINTHYTVKIQVNGSKLRAKWWEVGASEPEAWLLYADDNRILSGAIQLAGGAGSNYSNFNISTCLEDDTISIQETNTQNLLANNHAPEISDIVGVQGLTRSSIAIHYLLKDVESNFTALTQYQYSLTGAFTGEEKTMTPDNESGDGTSSLTSSSVGQEHIFAWDARADLENVYDATVYVRLQPKDSLEDGALVASQPFAVDIQKPVIAIDLPAQSLGSDTVTISGSVIDDNPFPGVRLHFSSDGGLTWMQSKNSISTDTGPGLLALWSADIDLPNREQDVLVKIIATDSFGNTAEKNSRNFEIDTKTPFGLANFHGQASDQDSILWEWSPVASEANFDRYEVWYDTDPESVDPSTATAKKVTPKANANLGIMGIDSIVIGNLQADTSYYARIFAYDTYGHEVFTVPVAEFRTKPLVGQASREPLSREVEGTLASPPEGGPLVLVGGDEALPVGADNPPTSPSGGFKVTINSGNEQTSNATVSLSLNAGTDVKTVAISNFVDMHDAIQVPYQASLPWNLCEQDGAVITGETCEAGRHTVYVRFYTEWGISSAEINDTIIFNVPKQAASESPAGNDSGSLGNSSGEGSAPGESGSSQNSSGGNGSANQTSGGDLQVPSENHNGANAVTVQTNTGVSAATIVPPLTVPVINNLTRAKESPILLVPKVASITQATAANTLELTGTSVPNTEVILFIHSDQVVMYSTKADHNGAWKFVHSQDTVNLAPGEHSIFAVTYDKGSNIKSKPSLIKTFEVKKSKLADLRGYFHLSTTLLTLLVGLLGAIYLFRHRLSAQPPVV